MDDNQHEQAAKSTPNGLTRRQVLLGIAATAAAAMGGQWLAACSPSTPAPQVTTAGPAPTTAPVAAPTTAPTVVAGPKTGGKVIWATNIDPTCIAPFGILPGAGHEGKELMYDSLVQWDRDLIVRPALAESWTTPDDKTYVFKLKQGIKFHDGSEMTADDVKFSVEMQKGDNLPKPGVPIAQYPAIASVEIVDKYTVKLNMKSPDPSVLGWFAWTRWSSITSKGFYSSGNPCSSAVGTGPYKLVEYVANDRVVMTKFADHWKKGLPYLDEITLKILPEEASRIAALRSGAIDGCDITSDTAKTLKNDPNISLLKGLTSAPRVLQFTIKGDGKPWSDKRVRQAMSMAINRQDLMDKVYGGEAELTGPIPPGYGDWTLTNDALKKVYKFDLDGAKKLLAEAGFKDGFEITINTISTADYQGSAEVVKEHLGKIGIDVKIVIEEIGIFAKRFADGTFEWLLNGFGMRDDPTGYLNWVSRPSDAQGKKWFAEGAGWKNEELTKTFEAVASNLDQKSRHPQIQHIQEIILDEVPFVYLCVPYKFTAIRSRIKNMYVSFTDFRPGLREVWING